MFRNVDKRLAAWKYSNDNKALLITGARQVGKTYSIRNFCKSNFNNFIELNMVDNVEARNTFVQATDAQDLLLRISAISKKKLVKNETVIFIDEVQECKEIVTAIKFLVEEGNFKYILSGSLLGIELKDIRSMPVGYMDIIEMYPMDFYEFCKASGVSDEVLSALNRCYTDMICVDGVIHKKMMDLFNLYLIVGGMPAAVKTYITTNNIRSLVDEQRSINSLYKADIAKYDKDNKLYIEEIFNLIPSELNNQNKRFILKNLNENIKFNRYENSFLWLKDAGVALPTYCANEPKTPLILSKSRNLFKLYHCDVGLLSSMYMDNIQLKILNNELNVNFGAVYENVVAEELKSKGFDLYYYNSKKKGEIDFLIELDGKAVPVEVKSGKQYYVHRALNNVLIEKQYGIEQAFVFSNENDVHIEGAIRYLPIYLIMFLQKPSVPDLIYKLDMSGLN